MSYKNTKKTLDDLYANLEKQNQSALEQIKQKEFKTASELLAKALGEADREVERARDEEKIINGGLPQEEVSKEEVENAYQRVFEKLDVLRNNKKHCDESYSKNLVQEEQQQALEHQAILQQKHIIDQQYVESYKRLNKLKEQEEPYAEVKDELTLFLKRVRQIHANKAMPVPELTKVMNATYDRLIGGPQDKFDAMVNRLNAQHSVPLKLLGATLILLGASLAAAAVFFAPAVITAAGVGLATTYLFTAGTAVASSALTAGGTACFFKSTEQMKLAKAGQKLGAHDCEYQRRYAPQAV